MIHGVVTITDSSTDIINVDDTGSIGAKTDGRLTLSALTGLGMEIGPSGDPFRSLLARLPGVERWLMDLPVLTLRQLREVNAASKKFHGIAGKYQGLGSWTDAWIEH